MDVPDDLMHHLDGFLGLIVHRGDVDEEQSRELLDRVKSYTRGASRPGTTIRCQACGDEVDRDLCAGCITGEG